MRNQFATRLRETKDREFKDGTMHGVNIALNIVTIALNNKFGFGKSRIEALEKEVSALFDEMVRIEDPELTTQKIRQRLKQIRGEEFEAEV